MGKAGRWLRNFLTGKKDSKSETVMPHPEIMSMPIQSPSTKENKRWSFRRSPTNRKPLLSPEPSVSGASIGLSEWEFDPKKHAMAVAAATGAAADAAVAAARAAAAVIRLTAGKSQRKAGFVDEADVAAVKIQAAFRGYLARKALCALKGLVKLQALVRGHLVRKLATETLRCMQALMTAQARVRAQRMQMVEESRMALNQPAHVNRRSPQHHRYRRSYEMDRSGEENVKIVEMDIGEPRPVSRGRNSQRRFSEYHAQSPYNGDQYHHQYSPSPSAITEMSPRAYSGHFEDFSFITAQTSPQCLSAMSVADPYFPNYMANTESSKAKARSQSAPRQRTDAAYERSQSSRRKVSLEGRNIPRSVKMQRSSSSHVGSTVKNGQYPWSVKLDRSSVSLKGSECGSISSVLTTNTKY